MDSDDEIRELIDQHFSTPSTGEIFDTTALAKIVDAMDQAEMTKKPLSGMPDKPRRGRRTREQIDELEQAIIIFIGEMYPVTVRQTYYHLVTRGLVAKTENGYAQVCDRLKTMRLQEKIPYGHIDDYSRSILQFARYINPAHAIRAMAGKYNKDWWHNCDYNVQFWCEKQALQGVMWNTISGFNLPLYVSKGQASITYIYQVAESIIERGDDAIIYYFGDYDKSGREIPLAIERGLRGHLESDGIDVEMVRVAVNKDQIELYNLPTREPKDNDPEPVAVELDAVPPTDLRDLILNCIYNHYTEDEIEEFGRQEDAERQQLRTIADKLLKELKGGRS